MATVSEPMAPAAFAVLTITDWLHFARRLAICANTSGGRARGVAHDDRTVSTGTVLCHGGNESERRHAAARSQESVGWGAGACSSPELWLMLRGVRQSRPRWSESDRFSRSDLPACEPGSFGARRRALPNSSRKRQKMRAVGSFPCRARPEIGWRVSTSRSYARRSAASARVRRGPRPACVEDRRPGQYAARDVLHGDRAPPCVP